MVELRFISFFFVFLNFSLWADEVLIRKVLELPSQANEEIQEATIPKENCPEAPQKVGFTKHCYDTANGSRIIDFTKIANLKFSDETILFENSGKVLLKDARGNIFSVVPIHMRINSLQEKTLKSKKKNRLSLIFPTLVGLSGRPLEIDFSFRVNASCTMAEDNSSNKTLCATNDVNGLVLNFLDVKKDEELLLESLVNHAGLGKRFFSSLLSSDTFTLHSEGVWDEFGNKKGAKNTYNGYQLDWDLSNNPLFISDFSYCSDIAGYQTFFSKLK